MNLISVKVLAASAAYLHGYARNLVASCFRTKKRSANAVVDGYIVTARTMKNLGNVAVMDTNCVFGLFDQNGGVRHVTVGGRDLFNSNAGAAPDGPYTTAGPEFKLGVRRMAAPRWLLGYALDYEDSDPFNPSPDPSDKATTLFLPCLRESPDACQSMLRVVTPGGMGPYVDPAYPMPNPFATRAYADCVPYRIGVDVNDYSTAGISMYEPYLADNLGYTDYRFFKYTDYGYMAFIYQRHTPVCAALDTVRVFAVPVCKQLGESVAHWGNAGVVFLATRYALDFEGQSAVKWHRIWEGSSHPEPCMHSGGWGMAPRSDSFLNPDAWTDFWGVQPDDPTGSIGSRPNFVDALSSCVETTVVDGVTIKKALFRFRYCNMSQVLDTTYGLDQFNASADAIVEVRVSEDGSMAVTYPFYEVAVAADSFYHASFSSVTPYEAYVVPDLDTAVCYTRVPMATLATEKAGVIKVDSVSAQPRVTHSYSTAWRPTSAAWMVADPTSGGLRIESGFGVFTVNFTALGFGVADSLVYEPGPHGDYIRLWGLTGYTVHNAAGRFNMLSGYEVGFTATATWDNSDTLSDAYLISVDVRTGVATNLGNTGVVTKPRGSDSTQLTVIQKRVVSDEGDVVIEGVYLATEPRHPTLASNLAVSRISRDSGATWQDYISSGQLNSLSGIAALGTELINLAPGALVLKG